MTILLLGGTAEARALAVELVDLDVLSSLAGRVSNPRLPVGRVRSGSFGGIDGLIRFLTQNAVDAVVDATHPFAATIGANAVAACARASVPLLRLERAPWVERPGDRWTRVPDVPAAAAFLPSLGSVALVTTGRQGLDAYAGVTGVRLVVRCVDPPAADLPVGTTVLLARGPYTYAGELALVREHAVDILVTKDSGGSLTEAKLDVARDLGLPVIVVDRPARPAARTVDEVGAAAAWVRSAGTSGA